MRSEVIPLRLQKVGREPRGTIAVEVGQGGTEGRNRHAIFDGRLDSDPPVRLCLGDNIAEVGVEDQVLQSRIFSIGLRDPVEEARADDAASPPDRGDVAEVEVPSVKFGRRTQLDKTLRVADDFARIEGIAHRGDQRLPVSIPRCGRWSRQYIRRGHAFGLHRTQNPRLDRAADDRKRNPHLNRVADGPFSRALLPRLVEDHINERLAGFRIFALKNIRGDLNQKRVEVPPVPFGKDFCKFFRCGSHSCLENRICFADQLHVSVFNPVVDHLHVVPGSVGSHVSAAGLALGHGGDLRVNRLELLPAFRRPSRHNRRTLKGTFLPAGNPHPEKVNSLFAKIFLAALRVRPKRIPAVDDDVTGLKKGNQLLDHRVHRRASLDHDLHLARTGQRGDKFLQGAAGNDVFSFGTRTRKFFRDGGCPVVDGHAESLGLHVQDQIFPHHGEADEADIAITHGFLWFCRSRRDIVFCTPPVWQSRSFRSSSDESPE